MTNYEKFMSKSVDELAKYIYENDHRFLDEVCRKSLPCPHGENAEEYNCINCVKVFLESEVEVSSVKKWEIGSPLACIAGLIERKCMNCNYCAYIEAPGNGRCDITKLAKDVLSVLSQSEAEAEKLKKQAEDFKKISSEYIEQNRALAEANYIISKEIDYFKRVTNFESAAGAETASEIKLQEEKYDT